MFRPRNGSVHIRRAIGSFELIKNQLLNGVRLHEKRIEQAKQEILHRNLEVSLLETERDRANRVVESLNAFIA